MPGSLNKKFNSYSISRRKSKTKDIPMHSSILPALEMNNRYKHTENIKSMNMSLVVTDTMHISSNSVAGVYNSRPVCSEFGENKKGGPNDQKNPNVHSIHVIF